MPRKLPIFYNALLLTGVNLLLRFVATSFQVFLSGQIGAAGIGLMQLVLSVGGLSVTLSMAGIRTGTMYLCAEELGKKRPENISWVLAACFTYSIICSAAVCIGLYALAPLIANHWIGHPETVGAIRLYASFLPVTCLCGVMIGYFTAANRITTLAIVEILEQALYMTITMALLSFWAGNNRILACNSVILGAGISSIVTLCLLAILRIRQKQPTGPRLRITGRLYRCAIPLALGDDLKAGISTLENLMIPKRLAMYGGVSDPLAAFGLVCGMVFPVLMFPAAIVYALAELLIPELARCNAAGSQTRVRYLVKKSLRVVLVFACLCCGTEYLLATELTKSLYQNAEAGGILKLYALLIPMLYCDAITDAMTKGLGQQAACVRYNILTAFLDVVFLFILLPKYGMAGYYISFFVTHLGNFILSLRRLKLTAKIKINWMQTTLTLVCTMLGVICSRTLTATHSQIVCFLLLFFSLMTLTGGIKRRDIKWVLRLIQNKSGVQ